MESNLFVCPFTGQKISRLKILPYRTGFNSPNFKAYYYTVQLNEDLQKNFILCSSFIDSYQAYNDGKELLNIVKPIILYEWLHGNLKEKFGGNVIHWDCDVSKFDDSFAIVPKIQELLKTDSYPKTSKEKIKFILDELYKLASKDIWKVIINQYPGSWGHFFLKDSEEALRYFSEIEKMDGKFITINGKNKDGFEIEIALSLINYYEEKVEMIRLGSDINQKFDIGLSFAGEDRQLVFKVKQHLESLGVSVFYDEDQEVDLWGTDLAQNLSETYYAKCKYCMIFISEHYAEKHYPKYEFRSALAKSIERNTAYILPVRIDDSNLPGLLTTTAYLDSRTKTPQEIAEITFKKLKKL
ncbi:MAG: TIR domain-containing protein [Saprospiraceae bacterium]|nr:TIR domain-containing protein [Saprospiraceae bacterium]